MSAIAIPSIQEVTGFHATAPASAASASFSSRWGYHAADYQTMRKARKLNGLLSRLRHRVAANFRNIRRTVNAGVAPKLPVWGLDTGTFVSIVELPRTCAAEGRPSNSGVPYTAANGQARFRCGGVTRARLDLPPDLEHVLTAATAKPSPTPVAPLPQDALDLLDYELTRLQSWFQTV